MSAGNFATARRGIDAESLRYANTIVQKAGYQAASMATGIAASDLREMLLPPPPRATYSPPMRTPAPKVTIPDASPQDALRAATKAASATVPRAEAYSIVSRVYAEPSSPRIPARKVIAEIAEQYGLTYADLIGPSRLKRIVRPRHHAYWAVRQLCPHLSYPEIGRRFGGRDHTTILHGVRAHEQRMAEGKA